MNHTITVLGLTTVLALASASPASAASNSSRLMGPDANLTCGTHWSEDGESINERGPGTVKLTTKRGKITATVKLRNAVPNTDYIVRVAQNSEDCHRRDAIMHTDNNGRASLTYTEDLKWRVAVVYVDKDVMHGLPGWRSQVLHTGWKP